MDGDGGFGCFPADGQYIGSGTLSINRKGNGGSIGAPAVMPALRSATLRCAPRRTFRSVNRAKMLQSGLTRPARMVGKTGRDLTTGPNIETNNVEQF